MPYKLSFSTEAKTQLAALSRDAIKLKRVRKCLGLIQTNPKHPSLNSHKYSAMKPDSPAALWESYVEKPPAAWRVFWHYGPNSDEITIVALTPHP